MIEYLHIILLIILGAVINEGGIKVTAIYFWLILVLLFGVLLTYDIIVESKQVTDEDEKNKDRDKDIKT